MPRARPGPGCQPSPGGGVPSRTLLVTRTPSGTRPFQVSAITCSQCRYPGAVSMSVMPPSTTARTVATASARSVRPQISPTPPPPRVRRLTSPNRPSSAPGRPPVHRHRPGPHLADQQHRAPHQRGQALPLRHQRCLLQPDRRLLHGLPDDRRARRFRAPQRYSAPLTCRNSPEGAALSNTNFRRRVWVPALAAVGLEGVHIHDLRHTGNQFTANAW